MLSGMIPSAPPTQRDHVDLTQKVREARYEIMCVNWRVMGFENMVQAFQSGVFLWTKCKFAEFCKVIHSMLVPAGSNNEIEVSFA